MVLNPPPLPFPPLDIKSTYSIEFVRGVVQPHLFFAQNPPTERARICEPLSIPGIDSQPSGHVRELYLSYWSARLLRLAESIPGLHKRLQIRALSWNFHTKYGG
jgi:hypothetical protein